MTDEHMRMTSPHDDLIGDINAPKGSTRWAKAVRNNLIVLIREQRATRDAVGAFFELMDKYEGYRSLEGPTGKSFRTLKEFCEAPTPYGLGLREVDVYKTIRDQRSLQTKMSNVRTSDYYEYENYLLARIKFEFPKILQRINCGEIKTTHEAAVAAGILPEDSAMWDMAEAEQRIRDLEYRQARLEQELKELRESRKPTTASDVLQDIIKDDETEPLQLTDNTTKDQDFPTIEDLVSFCKELGWHAQAFNSSDVGTRVVRAFLKFGKAKRTVRIGREDWLHKLSREGVVAALAEKKQKFMEEFGEEEPQ